MPNGSWWDPPRRCGERGARGARLPQGERRRLGQHPDGLRTGVQAAKIEDFRFHDPRHTYASHLVMRGRSLEEVQELSLPDRLREAVEAINFSTSSAQRGSILSASRKCACPRSSGG